MNPAMKATVEKAIPGTGRALDVGCGEGADALWLASRGWDVTGVDLSAVAVRRAADAARRYSLDSRTRFITADAVDYLSRISQAGETMELVTVSYLHMPGADELRRAILHAARDATGPGGHLLLVSHSVFPPLPVSREENANDRTRHSPDSELNALGVTGDDGQAQPEWTVVRSGISGHNSDRAADTVILVRRETPRPEQQQE
ncbi:hypothetical protein BJF89_02455 [Corynebacterium sp. CNJ-954]|nr:hypothetical protein BJF89_02455 [Corynebacterium sp. CNJ-954]